MKRLMLILSCLILSVGMVVAQTKQASGVVLDDTGAEVIGAAIIVKGTSTGTITDADGKFSLNVPAGKDVLVVSYVGMQSQEVKAAQNLRIVLESSTKLDEVTVVAYGVQSTRTLASAVSSVRADDIKDVPGASFDQMLQGRATGVSITTPSAGVGQAPIVRVRGVNSISSGTSPLYVVDGIIMTSGDIASLGNANALADINPADIASMEVLKDAAAAALYGSRAANGVILITTKSGGKGKAKVAYSGYVGVSNKTKFFDMMNAQQYVDFKNMAYANYYGSSIADPDTGDHVFNLMSNGNGGYYDTDWSKEVFQTGVTQNQNLSVTGGNELLKYYFSANYITQDGIVKGDKYDKLAFKASVDVQATNWLKLGVNITSSNSTTSYVDAARNGSTFSVGGFPRLAIVNAPNIPSYGPDGKPYYEDYISNGSIIANGLGYGNNYVFSTYSNPAAILNLGNGIDTEVNRSISILYGEVKPIANLVFRTQFGLDRAKVEDERFWSPTHGDGFSYHALANRYAATTEQWTWTNTATYSLNMDRNHFNFLVGSEAMQKKYNYWTAQRKDIVDAAFTGFETGYLTNTASGNITERTMASFFARVNYDFDYKYILSLNYRRDGLSSLSKENRWGDFGGVSAAWRLSDENFMSSIKDLGLQDLKLKASYGLVGNADIPTYASRSYYRNYYYGNNGSYGLYVVNDPDIKWEKSNKYDFGFEAKFLDRFSVDFDYYLTKSSDLILEVPQPLSLGIPDAKILQNYGDMENSGIELNISADIIKDGDFKWNSSLNLTTNRNKVTSLTNEILMGDDSGLETTNITVVGKSIGQLYLYPTAGIDAETGRRIFIAKDGRKAIYKHEENKTLFYEDGTTGKIDSDVSRVIAGNTLPTWYGGWTNNFSYKNFDLSVFFQFSGGNKILNGTKATTSDMRYWNNSIDVLNKYWTPERGANAKYAYPIYGDNASNGSAYPLTDWVEDGDYLRLKNISIGYTFPKLAALERLGISSLRLYGQAQNLFVITGYSGLDPEVLSNVMKANLAGGVDKNTLPQAKVFTFGLNVTF